MAAGKFAYSLVEVEALTPFDLPTIRRAINATDPTVWPPPLRAKATSRDKNGKPKKLFVTEPDLRAWLESMPDA